MVYTFAFVVLIVFAASFAVKKYYEDGVKRHLAEMGDAVVQSYSEAQDVADNEAWAIGYLDKLEKKESADVAAQNSSGHVFRTLGAGGEIEAYKETAETALKLPEQGEFYFVTLQTGEKVLSRTVVIGKDEGAAALTFYEPMEKTDRRVAHAVLVLIFSAIALLAVFTVPTLLFLNTIVKPVRELRATAHMIAQGDYDARVDKMYDDEIGELAESINCMAEDIKNSDAMKNDFISSVSHELRTPLTAIKGWAETMSCGEMPPETMKKGFEIIINESERLTGMVEELLDFSRLQNGKMILAMDKTDLLAELEEAVYMLKERAAKEGQHIVYDPPEELPAVFADKNRIRQVFINIIDNALKYSPKGGVVGVDVKQTDEYIKIIVSDSGCGIAPKDLPRIKEKFYKANKTVRGSGIGLAVADEIMTLHKGSLEIESEEDKGTKVTISIPILDEDDEEILNN